MSIENGKEDPEEIAKSEKNTQINNNAKKKSFLKSNLNNPFSKIFIYYFFLFFIITITTGMIYDLNTNIFGMIVFILFPFVSGFFFLYLLFPLIFQNKRNKDSFVKKYNKTILISSMVLFIPIWIVGVLNMFLGLFVFVYILVIGNLSSMLQKGNRIHKKLPANKFLSLLLLSVSLMLPLVFFGIKLVGEVGAENILNFYVVFSYLLSRGIILLVAYASVLILCPISIVIIIFQNKEIGKRVAFFCLFFVWIIMTWTYEFIAEFSPAQTAIAQLPILLFTIYNIFSKFKGDMEDFDDSIKKAHSSLFYNLLNKRLEDDVLNALIFIFFCSQFFGYLTAKTSLSIITTTFTIWGIPIPDIGNITPSVLQVILALILVVPFLLIKVIH